MSELQSKDVRIALVNVPPPEVVQRGPGGADKPMYPHIGLAYLSAILKKNGLNHLVIDCPFDGLSLNELETLLCGFRPSIIGFTSMTHQMSYTSKVAKKLKYQFKDALFLIGGSHATVAPGKTLEQFPFFDIAVIGEGERTLVDIVRMIQAKRKDPSKIKGIAFRSGDEIKVTIPRPFIEDLNSLPFPDFSHIKNPMKIYPIISSRGCPFRCIFCCRILGNKLRVRSPLSVVKEIEHAIIQHHSKIIDFADEQVTIPRNRILKICELLIEKGYSRQIQWTALSRVDAADQELFYEMKKAGCIRIAFGVESGNQEILKRIRKGITIEDAEKAINMAKNAKLRTDAFFILGHPNETIQTINETIRLASRLNTDTVSFALMVPYPGTEIYQIALNGEGNYRLISDNWSDFDKQLGNALELKNVGRKELEKMQLKAYTTFYLRNYRYFDMLQTVFYYRKLFLKMLRKAISRSFG